MEPGKGEGDNQTNGKFGKLNKWKICISGFFNVERSLHINVLNVETEPRMSDRENWTNGKFTSLVLWVHKGHHTWVSECRCQWKQNVSVGPYEKIENWLPFHKYWLYRKISNYWPPEIGSPVFQVSTEMEYHCWPLWKNRKMATTS